MRVLLTIRASVLSLKLYIKKLTEKSVSKCIKLFEDEGLGS